MKELKAKSFWTREDLTKFVKEFGIQREDIFIITEPGGGPTLWYYA
ncbi:hypothetical protein [Mucilaginibacter phyllosphaerae]|uniref:Uncharacterized protein n=1 Tax=Mucilaginibacter phyllosphaerae TaxID=1812349 RepID=A0ABR6I410_9SPHI|nr:hypothetical protein [Mucilaginibacter phyllosphaerae]MBB3967732.1 hypothetical protein [Mucilaginibacter phyllosphaerae]GGH03698.1 hypothetical protein GCM10007352_06470 [Mucilaginibacter phyllosphaerae]